MDSSGQSQYRQTNSSVSGPQAKMYERRRSSIFPSFLRSGQQNPRESIGTLDSINLEPYITNEPVPSAEFYDSNVNTKKQRPTYDDLHQPFQFNKKQSIKPEPNGNLKEGFKMGWINGVWIRTLLNIWGVELFLRMGWMVGQSGIIVAVFQIVLSSAISIVTALSMSAICTNGKIGTGGTYYMISRSLGVEAGAMIGTITYFSMCVLNSLNIIGAAEGVVHILNLYQYSFTGSELNDIRLVGVVLLSIIAVIPLFGMAWESKTHWIMFTLLVTALLDYALGTFFNIDSTKQLKGLTGWDLTTIKANLWPDYRYNQDFYTVIAVFFPMVTGIFAGSGMSGDLRDPSKAIPKGTIWSIVASSLSYVLVVIFLGCSYIRYVDVNGNRLYSYDDVCVEKSNCPDGLVNNYQTITYTSLYSPLIYVGIFISAISSSLAVYVAAPRMFQAFSRDRLFPYIEWFGQGHGPNNEPYHGYLITFCISFVFVIVGDLNAVAPIISSFKLASFFLVNFTCFHASYINSPSFRPSFRYFNKWLSLVVGLFSFVFMFFLHWDSAIVTVILSIIIFVLVNKRSPKVNWGSTTEDQVFTKALSSLNRLNQIPNHVKNYRPSILLLAGNPSARQPLVAFAGCLTKNVGLLTVAQISRGLPKIDENQRQLVIDSFSGWLAHNKIRGFYTYFESDSLSTGSKKLVQLTGIGKLKPNILMMGFKHDWRETSERDMLDYFGTLNVAFEMYMAIAIFRNTSGLDFTNYMSRTTSAHYSIEINGTIPALDAKGEIHNPAFEADFDISSPASVAATINNNTNTINLNGKLPSVSENEADDDVFVESKIVNSNVLWPSNMLNSKANALEWPPLTVFQPEAGKTPEAVDRELKRFSTRQPKGFIDVWWIHDDGGLTLLLPYILSKHKYWNQNKLRVFTVVPKDSTYDQQNLRKLLKQFRIPFSDVIVITESEAKPSELRKQKFKSLIEKHMAPSTTQSANFLTQITKQDLVHHKDKTCKILKLRDLLENYSKDSNLIVMTLPVMRKNACPAPLYLAWIDALSQDLPPFLFVRGNQTNVLTFYL